MQHNSTRYNTRESSAKKIRFTPLPLHDINDLEILQAIYSPPDCDQPVLLLPAARAELLPPLRCNKIIRGLMTGKSGLPIHFDGFYFTSLSLSGLFPSTQTQIHILQSAGTKSFQTQHYLPGLPYESTPDNRKYNN